jgi:hypothetical protein
MGQAGMGGEQQETLSLYHYILTTTASGLNSAEWVTAPLVFRTVLEVLTSHGSSMTWCLLCIPVRPDYAGALALSSPVFVTLQCRWSYGRLV